MDYVRFFILTLCLGAWFVRDVAPLEEKLPKVDATNGVTTKESKINSQLTEVNFNKTFVKDHKKDDSNTPRIRKVTHVDSFGAVDNKLKEKLANPTTKTTTAEPVTSATPKLRTVNVSEGVLLNVPATNVTTANKAIVEHNDITPMLVTSNTNTSANSATSNNASGIKQNVNHAKNNISNVNDSTTVGLSKSSASNTTSSAGESKIELPAIETKLSNKNTTASTGAAPTSSTTITSSTTTSTSTASAATSSTTTTPKPKKPKITYGVQDFPDLDKESLAIHNLTQQQSSTSSSSTSSGKFPLPEAPYAQPSQELSNTSFHGGRDYILPIVSMIFIIPLVIGILITTYRRFRDCWSTRHYRRMDFLVDGMYND